MSTVLITGANRGLGLEFARQYAADGWGVIGTAREAATAAELSAISGVEAMTADVSRDDSVARLGEQLKGRAIDLVISNAGVYGRRKQALGNLDTADWLETFNINTLGPVRLAEALRDNLKAAARQGGTPKLALVTSLMGSIADASEGHYVYRTSKAALNMAGKLLAKDLEPDRITVLLLHPGWVQTDMGGETAPLKPQESIAGLRKVIAGTGLNHTGAYLDYQGKSLPW